MSHFNEHTLEMAIMSLFEQQGYVYTCGSEIVKGMDEVVLRDDLKSYLQRRYAGVGLTEVELEGAMAKLMANGGGTLYENNAYTYRLMTEGFALKREDGDLNDVWIEPIDFEHVECNIFRIVNQLEIVGGVKRIPDGIVYVNGLPVVVLEFKSAVKEETTIMDAYRQLTVRYRRDIPELFKYNAFVVISDGVNNKYGSLFTPYEFFYAWRKVNAEDKVKDGIDGLKTMVDGLLAKGRLLEVMRDFVMLPDASKSEQKIICRYPQYFATQRLFENIAKHSRMNADGDGKGGTYFGATGCGKSYAMLFLTRRLMRSRIFKSPTIVLITDRTDLDDQLSAQFVNAKRFIGDDCVKTVSSREDLRNQLKGRTSGGVFLTTIQKFTEDTKLLSDRANIICISDEAHRSQTNMLQQIRQTKMGVKRSYGFAKYLHDSFPQATYVGFTGTPIDATIEVFGEVVDAYTMTQSVADGITRKIVYEGRAARVMADGRVLEEIEKYYKECEDAGANEYQIEESKRAVTKLDRILGDKDRLRAVAKDFVAHYEGRIEDGSTVCGKAMVVCANRRIAYDLYKEILKLRPEWGLKSNGAMDEGDGEILELGTAAELVPAYGREGAKPMERMRLVMTRSKDDPEELWELLGSDEERKGLDREFKDAKSNFKIAIVVDMWVTGFDVPCLDTMYIDKPLHKHTLIQTISRVNRVYKGKEKGLIVDYIGIKKSMAEALRMYAEMGDGEGNIETMEQSVKMVKDELDILRRMFVGFDYKLFTVGTPLEQLDCLNRGAEFVQRTKEKENLFMGHAKKLKMAYNLCGSSEEILDEDREDLNFFCGVRSVVYKLTKGECPDATQMNKKVSEMIEEAIQSEGVEEIAKIGEDKANMELLSDEYMERLKKMKLPNTRVKLMERLLKMVITEFKKVNKVKGIDFTQRLNGLVESYNNRTDDVVFADEVLTEVANKMADLLKEINKEKGSFEAMGITYEEKAFYDILMAVAAKFKFEYPEDKCMGLAARIKEIVDEKSSYTDWANRDDIKADLKMNLVLVMDEFGYPPVTIDEVYKDIFEQAENFKKYRG